MLRDDSRNRIRFDSLPEFVTWLKANDTGSYRMTAKDKHFFGDTSGPQALHFAACGNDANVPEAQRLLDQFSAELETLAWQDEPTVAGCYPIVAEFLAGEPECMRLPTLVGSEAAPLSVFVDLTCSGGVTPAEIKTRGIAVLAAVMALSAVRPVTLEVGCVMGTTAKGAPKALKGERVSMVSVVLDTAPLDLSTAAWMLSDVAAARRLMYSVSEILHDFSGNWPTLKGAEHGASGSEAYAARVRTLLDLPGDTLYVPAVSSFEFGNARDIFDNPIKWAERTVQQFGRSIQQ